MLKLSEQEKQILIRHLEADKALPDKYRFLLFDDKREVELVWNGKSAEVCNVVLPFQTIEHVDEPRAEKPEDQPLIGDLFTVDSRGRQLQGWTNKLIWGDNKLILSSLKSGAYREEIERQGGIKLIYVDPPFDVGADFSMNIEVGGDTFTKAPNVLEEIAYRDTWGKGADSFIAMIYERLVLMRDLLAEDGSIYVHCDWRVNSFIRLAMDEIFGYSKFVNQIEWGYKTGGIPEKIGFAKKHDHILFYSKGTKPIFNPLYQKSYVPTLPEPHTNSGKQLGVMRDAVCDLCQNGKPGEKYRMVIARDVWDDIASIFRNDLQVADYPTQKPEALLERIIKASSNEGDLVADFFCGSGTLAAVAEKLGRKWICSDLGKFAIHTIRKRMIGVQRQLKADGKNYRAFEILNLGKYERQHYVGVNPDLREREQQQQQMAKEKAFVDLILRAYRAEHVDNFAVFHGKKQGRLVAVGPVNLPISRQFVEEIIRECRQKHITKADLLGFEFEMALFPHARAEAREQGIDLVPKYIPAGVFDKRAVEKDQVVFHDVAYIEVKPFISYPPDKGGLPYNTALTAKARENRKNPTPAEKKLWFEVLQSRQFSGLKFSRQKPLAQYIVDFYCAERMLAIEIDGDNHAGSIQYDESRTRKLKALGVEVVRYTNAEVMTNLEAVHDDLLNRVAERKPPKSPLSGGLPNSSFTHKSSLVGGLPTIAVELTDFSVHYHQGITENVEQKLKNKGSKVVVEKGQVVKISKDGKGAVSRKVLTEKWTDWVDYWSVDFDYESKREMIRVRNDKGEWEEKWTGDYVFENEWQSFRTRQDRALELTSVAHECPPGNRKIAVKVVDIFGNDTMTIVEVKI